MNTKMILSTSLIGLVAAFAACSSSSSTGGSTSTDAGSGSDSGSSSTGDSGGGGAATIAISAPTAGSTLTLTGGMGDIAFTVTNFTLKAPGSCNGASDCGHVHVLIDGTACNDTASGAPYNIAANASPAQANFSFCPTADGAHVIVLELHNDDHSPFLGTDGKVVSATVSVTTSG